jgi:hypothetical protein
MFSRGMPSGSDDLLTVGKAHFSKGARSGHPPMSQSSESVADKVRQPFGREMMGMCDCLHSAR